MPSEPAFARYDPRRRALPRLIAAIAAGLGAYLASAWTGLSVALRAVAAWDIAATVLLALAWWIIEHADAQETRRRAAAEDPGRTTVSLIVILSSLFSLFAATVTLRQARQLPHLESGVFVALCLGAVACAWALTHTSYTLRYAHLYYRDAGEGEGGLVFPGEDKPDDCDFAYFAFTVGMCFQVSDVVVSTRIMRKVVLGHAVLSFVYNTTILALALNLAFGLLS